MKIIAVSCDLYSDCVPAFEHLLYKHWRDCPFELEYVTNRKELHTGKKVHYIAGRDIDFGWRMINFLDTYDDELLLFMMADYLIKSVDTYLIDTAHVLCAMKQIGHVRLRPMPHPEIGFRVKGFGEIRKGSRYSLSLQPGIWEKQILRRLLLESENAHQTEVKGSVRTVQIRKAFLSVDNKPAISHLNYYRKGKPDGLEWVKENVHESCWPDGV